MNKYLDIDYLKSLENKPYYFGLGFIQLKINKEHRIHFWHTDLIKTAGEEELHNHRYNFKSHVLKGKLLNEVFTYDKVGSEYGLYQVSCSADSSEESKHIFNCTPIKVCSFETTTGQSYTLDHNFFHTSHTDGCITLLERDDIVKEYAHVISLNNKSIACPFSIKLIDDQIWSYIEDLINNY